MANPKIIEIFAPDKGTDKNTGWAKRTPDVLTNALNVFPADSNYRRRISQRPGIVDTLEAPLDPSARPVRLLRQVTVIPEVGNTWDPTDINTGLDFASGIRILGGWDNAGDPFDPPTPLGFENYADNTQIDSTGDWLVGGTPSTNLATILGNAFDGSNATVIWESPTPGSQTGSGIITTSPGSVAYAIQNARLGFDLGATYAITTEWEDVDQTTSSYVIFARRDDDDDPTETIYGQLSYSAGSAPTLAIFRANGGAALVTQTFAADGGAGSSINLLLLVDGDEFTLVYQRSNGGTLRSVTTTTTVGAGKTGWGFGQGTSSAGARLRTIYVSTVGGATIRSSKLIGVSNGTIYTGSPDAMTATTNGTSVLQEDVYPGFAATSADAYFADGNTTVYTTDLTTNTTSALTASAGSVPTGCTLATIYRGRLVLSGQRDSPQNVYFSRLGDATDWDYAQTDPAAAFAGNNSEAGRVTGVVTALITLSDDLMLIAGDNAFWVMRGDPADGGSIDLLSDSIGIYGPNAWTKAPDGTVYFVGSGGFFMIPPGAGSIVPISYDSWDEIFAVLDRGQTLINLAYDRDRQGLLIGITDFYADLGDAHLWFDTRSKSFWQQSYPTNKNPLTMVTYDGDGYADRFIMWGARNGYIYYQSRTATNDDNTAITSYIQIGPIKPAGAVNDSVLQWVDVLLGEGDLTYGPGTLGGFGVDLEVQSDSNETPFYGTPRRSTSVTYAKTQRQPRKFLRTSGNAFVFRFVNDTLDQGWSLERVNASFLPMGLVKRF